MATRIDIDRHEAAARFEEALALARSSEALPSEWLDRTEKVGAAESATFTPMLGTALLAKATNRFVDPFSLKHSTSHKSYSARGLAQHVLVPCCVKAGVNIRTTGGEPLNNSPFYKESRVTKELNVKPSAKADLDYLYECLERVDFLENDSALRALAAFLRVRIAHSQRGKVEISGSSAPELPDMCRALDAFVAGDNEGGKVGQAVVAAILDLVFADVRTKRINDPSSKWPGDVGVFVDGTQTLAFEVKQKSVSETAVLQFAERLYRSEVHRGFVAALSQREQLNMERWRMEPSWPTGVEVRVYTQASAILRDACSFASNDLPLSLHSFGGRVLLRLEQIECSTARQNDWVALVSADTPTE